MTVQPDVPVVPNPGTGDRFALETEKQTHEHGASAIEYALLIGLIALVIFAAMALLGVNVREFYSSIATGY